MGERFVQEVKNTKEQCPSKHILQNLLQKLHEGKSIESMAQMPSKKLQTMRSMESSNRKDPKGQEILGNAKVFKTLEMLTAAFHNESVLSAIETKEKGFSIMYYAGGSTRGKIWMRYLERQDVLHAGMHGIRYWPWKLLNEGIALDDVTIEDFVVLLPKAEVGAPPGQFTMVTKEWSPAMLDHYALSWVGIDQKMDGSVYKRTIITSKSVGILLEFVFVLGRE
jgi:hypothetical protein